MKNKFLTSALSVPVLAIIGYLIAYLWSSISYNMSDDSVPSIGTAAFVYMAIIVVFSVVCLVVNISILKAGRAGRAKAYASQAVIASGASIAVAVLALLYVVFLFAK